MEHMFKKILPFALLLGTAGIIADDCCNSGCETSCNTSCFSCETDCCETMNHVTTCFMPRSQSRNNVMKTAGLDPDHEYLFDMDCIYGTFNIGVEYTHSFSEDDIARCLFGPAVFCGTISSPAANCCPSECDECVTIRVVGSTSPITPNGTTDLVAEFFFLPPNFASTVSFCPSISNINVPMHMYLGLDEWCDGLYFRLYAPVTHTRWKLEANETIINPGTEEFAAGIASPVIVPADNLFSSFLSFTSGNSITLPASTPGVTVQPLLHQRILPGCDALTKTGLADLRAELGWNFLLDECYHLGVYLQMAAPTGNDCSPCFLFGPIVGNGKHWELGGGLTGHYTLWRSEDDEQEFGFYVEADVAHMFSHEECRTFDLKCKPLSRYIYAEKVTTADTALLVDGAAVNLQFADVWAPVANFSTFNVDVSYAVQGDVLAKFVYTCRGWGWEIGYNFWGRSCEKIELDCECPINFPANTWALICDPVFGFTDTGTPHELPISNSGMTVFACGNTDNSGTPVTFNDEGTLVTPPGNGDAVGSNPVVTISQDDFDFCAGSRGISHKVFTHFNYTWIDCEDWIPYIGFGASAEFGSNKDRGCNSSCSTLSSLVTNPCCEDSCNTGCDSGCDNGCDSGDSCPDCSLSQWAVWFKVGVSFN
ncbi:MAG TPA: hypothetical protein VGW78_03215 [Candidatus Babeliales bacterium]|jgi:hypothetical protein|nr:hypothetical protein [Candidatus Babeliales bacterium]